MTARLGLTEPTADGRRRALRGSRHFARGDVAYRTGDVVQQRATWNAGIRAAFYDAADTVTVRHDHARVRVHLAERTGLP